MVYVTVYLQSICSPTFSKMYKNTQRIKMRFHAVNFVGDKIGNVFFNNAEEGGSKPCAIYVASAYSNVQSGYFTNE